MPRSGEDASIVCECFQRSVKKSNLSRLARSSCCVASDELAARRLRALTIKREKDRERIKAIRHQRRTTVDVTQEPETELVEATDKPTAAPPTPPAITPTRAEICILYISSMVDPVRPLSCVYEHCKQTRSGRVVSRGRASHESQQGECGKVAVAVAVGAVGVVAAVALGVASAVAVGVGAAVVCE